MRKERYNVEKIGVGAQRKNDVATLRKEISLRHKGKQEAQIQGVLA